MGGTEAVGHKTAEVSLEVSSNLVNLWDNSELALVNLEFVPWKKQYLSHLHV